MTRASSLELPADLLALIDRDAKYFARVGGPAFEADDMRQDGALAALELLARRGQADAALLRHAASHAMIAALRWARSRPSVEMTDATRERLATRSGDQITAIDVTDAIDSLPANQRAAILSTLDGPASKTHADLGLTRRVLNGRIERARKSLRDRLGAAYAHMARKHPNRYGKIGRANAKKRKRRNAAKENS